MIKMLINSRILKICTIIIIILSITYLVIDYQSFKIPIFGFHNIVDGKNSKSVQSRATYLDYTKQDLRELLDYLLRENYWFLTTQELYDYFLIKSRQIPAEHLDQKPVMITFDDGYKNLNVYLLPIVKSLEEKYSKKIKVVLFINPKFMENQKSNKAIKYLNCADLRLGLEQGVYDIQSHGFSHAILTKLSVNKLEFELSESQNKLKQCTASLPGNETVALHLAYPYNKVNQEVKKYTAKYYLSGYLYNDEIQKLNWFKNNYKISRLAVFRRDSPQKLIKAAQRASYIR